jgi:glutamate/tyrosine decarboxylase-like PLP-dependent enzyme
VFGGTLPAALAANWLAGAWDQNVVYRLSSPVGAQLEKVAGQWLLDVLALPPSSAVGFVTGTTMANFSAVLAARHAIWSRLGWNSKEKGTQHAPPIRVVVGQEVHASMLKALVMAGFGTAQLERVPVDDQGRMIVDKLPLLDQNTLLCTQAGNVNSGAIDPLVKIADKANNAGAWMHVDSAFGLWARATPLKKSLAEGCERADSWAVDLHKWLNLPYDSGLIICRDPRWLHEAMSVTAPYLPDDTNAEPCFFTPELSRRARGAEAWAALYSLGRNGLAEMIERCCELATLFGTLLQKAGYEILNDIVLNQVLVSFGTTEQTNRIIKKIQDDGTCWCGGTVWQGKTAMRISVCSWMTREEDIRVSAKSIIKIAQEETAR